MKSSGDWWAALRRTADLYVANQPDNLNAWLGSSEEEEGEEERRKFLKGCGGGIYAFPSDLIQS